MRLSSLTTLVLASCLSVGFSLAQKNQTAQQDYKLRKSTVYDFSTSYDNGYVMLLDSTILKGDISIAGSSYKRIMSVKIRTNAGDKYVFSTRSLIKYGLSNDIRNDTPSKFNWSSFQRNALGQSIRTATSYGYVKTKEGKNYEGVITLREIKGDIRTISVSGVEKVKLDVEEVTNFGAIQFVDDKFDGPWQILRWSPTLTAYKSNEFSGYVELNSGQKITGIVELTRKGSNMLKVFVKPTAAAKSKKYKHEDVKSYGSTITATQAKGIIFGSKNPENYSPKYRFYNGYVTLSDGSELKGLIAQTSTSDVSDIYYAQSESTYIRFIESQSIEDIYQDIPEADFEAYDDYIYDITHIQGYKKMNPPVWDYDKKTADEYITNYQPGYIVTRDGEEKIGALSIRKYKNGNFAINFKEVGSDNAKSPLNAKYGLIEVDATTAFPINMFGLRKKPGFVKLIGSNEYLKGDLSVYEDNKSLNDRAGGSNEIFRIFNLDADGEKVKHPEANVERYGLLDVPVKDLQENIISVDPKQYFSEGSFKWEGQQKNGFIAYALPNEKNEFQAFFFAESLAGSANIYYLDQPEVSDVNQVLKEELAEYDPLNDDFLLEKAIAPETKINGYVIDFDGNKIEGDIQLSIAPKMWFATEVTVTKKDGTILNFKNDGSLQKIILNTEDGEREFLDYEGEYVEVYKRVGHWVYFRNPHPTTLSVGASFANQFMAELSSQAFAQAESQMLSFYISRSRGSRAEAIGFSVVSELYGSFKEKWQGKDLIQAFKKEYMIFDEARGIRAMIIPSFTELEGYAQLESVLKGCQEFLPLKNSEQKEYYKLNNPEATLNYLNINMSN